MYDVFKVLHVVGVVILVGNVTITAFWKVFSDMTGDPRVIAHAQRGVTVADFIFTLAGIVLIMIGGYGAAILKDLPLFTSPWLVAGQILFAVSGVIWLGILVPLQIRQARVARSFAQGGEIPEGYRRDARLWIIWGVIATVPLVAAIYVMVVKI
ncbi:MULTISPECIES: DUF2269 domain-containing protein [Rhodopseudomonas]|uniref:Membrane protein n=1 Tax=Rhodopseudomonas palustris TaxID=1076 RepID=A0A0D7EXI4_RHOPL|nr:MULTISPECIES: DUF2269 domain-containing protein [Rhodopseudomonas]KIZ45569.1 membrane protein [Rhodopseudomonas palustris]MDF3814021.1 DUF2269 domain-containing protein [Rhodopseudomonas sp. BAL398]WOK16840.1 DUF2269 domain-containing protein [Rhodopseudomonas sp. BAL398]